MKRLISLILIFSLYTVVEAQPPDISGLPRIRLTDSVECTSVKDQGGSPTCWVFGTNSLFESDLIREQGIRLNLSEMFIARYAYIDKTKRFLESGGKTYFEGGGQFHDVIRVIKKHGMVPEEVYNGRPDEKLRHDHSGLDTAMKVFTHGLLKQGRKDLSSDELRQMNDTLDKYLGKVPSTFSWQQKVYTPVSFAKEVLRFADEYVELVSFADRPLYKQFILADKYNWANDSFWNISLAEMQMLVDTALHMGWSVGWEGDVTEAGFNYFSGYARLPEPVSAGASYPYDEQRLENYKTETTERDHMLQITATGKDEEGKKWYKMKNSWGTWLSTYKGYLFMEEDYFRMKTVIMMVNKKALPQKLKEKLEIR